MPNSLPSTASRLYCRVERLGEDRVQRFGEPLARAFAVDGRVLGAVGNPDVGDAGSAQGLADRGADAPAGDPVIDPEPADRLVGVGQGVAVGRQRVGEIGRVEVHADPPGLRPVDPASEMFGLESVALDLPAAGLGIAGVEVQAMRAGQERQRLVQVGPELVGRAGLAGIMAGDRQAAAELLAGVLESADVVALPAVQRDRDGREPCQGRIDIDAPFRVLLLRAGEGALHVAAGRGHGAILKKAGLTGMAQRRVNSAANGVHSCQPEPRGRSKTIMHA